MNKRTLLLLFVLLLAGGVVLYQNRFRLSSSEQVLIVNTSDSLASRLKIYAALDAKADTVLFENRQWHYADHSPLLLVFDGKNWTPLSKHYQHVDFYIAYHDQLFTDIPRMHKLNSSLSGKIQFASGWVNGKLCIGGMFERIGDGIARFDNRPMSPLYDTIRFITFPHPASGVNADGKSGWTAGNKHILYEGDTLR